MVTMEMETGGSAGPLEDDLTWKQRLNRMEERVKALEEIITSNGNPPMSMAPPVPSTSFGASISPISLVKRNFSLVEEKQVKNAQLKFFIESLGGGGVGDVFQPCCDGRASLFTSPANGDKYLFIHPSPQFEFSFEFHPDGVVKETEKLNEPSKKFPQSVLESCKVILVPVTFYYEIHNLKDEELESVNQVYPDLERYKAGKPYTALYVISGGPAGQQGIFFEGSLTINSDKEKVRLIYQLVNKLTQKMKACGLELEPKGNKLSKILHKFGGTVSVPNWDLLVIFWILETIVKKTKDAGEPIQLNNLDPFSNVGELQQFFKRVGKLMANGGYPSWKAEMNEALANWEDVFNLEDKRPSPPTPPIPATGGDSESSDSEGSSVFSLFIPVKTKIKKNGRRRKSVRFTACQPSAAEGAPAAEIPPRAERSPRENVRRAVNVKIKRKWVNVKIKSIQGQQAWEAGKRVKVVLVKDVTKKEKE